MQDLKYKEFHGTLCNTCKYEIIGVRIPEIREYAKELIKEDYTKFLNSKDIKYYEEIMLKGIIIGTSKMTLEDTFTQLEKFIPYIDNWAVCDIMSPKVFRKHKEELINQIKKWSKSNKTYTIRFGIEMLMSHYLDDNFKEEYLKIPASVKKDEYYVKMMIAWFYATALAKQYDATIPYLKKKTLSTWVHNKTIQKAIESYRITEEQKTLLRGLKKK